jgi:hypothetical protein
VSSHKFKAGGKAYGTEKDASTDEGGKQAKQGSTGNRPIRATVVLVLIHKAQLLTVERNSEDDIASREKLTRV